MDARTFRNQVLMMAEEYGINFLLIAEGEFAQRGTMQEIINSGNSTDAKPYTSALVKGATETYEDMFKLIDSIPGNPGEPLYLNTGDIEEFRVQSGSEYTISVAADRKSFMIIAGNIDNGMPLVNVTRMESNDVTITSLGEMEDPKDPNATLVVGTDARVVPMGSMIQGSMTVLADIPTHISNELETLLIAAVRLS